MLRIDENSKTLVAPQEHEYVPEPGPGRDELHALLSAGWSAFAGEIGQPHLHAVAPLPEYGIDILAVDEAAGRAVVVVVAEGEASPAVGRALHAAAELSSWDADQLGMHEGLQSVIPGDSPRIVVVGPRMDPATLKLVDWLVRRHGIELHAYGVEALRYGSERMISFVSTFPVAHVAPVEMPAPEAVVSAPMVEDVPAPEADFLPEPDVPPAPPEAVPDEVEFVTHVQESVPPPPGAPTGPPADLPAPPAA